MIGYWRFVPQRKEQVSKDIPTEIGLTPRVDCLIKCFGVLDYLSYCNYLHMTTRVLDLLYILINFVPKKFSLRYSIQYSVLSVHSDITSISTISYYDVIMLP